VLAVAIAAIDLGSNTVRLLVVAPGVGSRWTVLEQDQRVTRLGEGLAASGRLGEAAMARTREVVTAYAARAVRRGAADVRIVATSAVRQAANGRAFAAALEQATGRTLEVLTGDAEARMIVLGVLHGLGPAEGRTLIFDIGGGSTEYIRVVDGTVTALTSLPLGVVPLAEAFPFPDPVDPPRYDALERHVRDRLDRELPASLRLDRVDRVIGTAGTVTTLAALDLGLTVYDGARIQGHRLTASAIDGLLARLRALAVDERARLPCLEPGRADLIIPGLAIVRATLAWAGVDGLRVSDDGLREGILVDLLDRRG
jgi:exopolyphosphatase/guanosine-5'-triphosphate,3'-diphosphate pyrophosphatase